MKSQGVALGFQMGQGGSVAGEGGSFSICILLPFRICSPELGDALHFPAPAARARPPPYAQFSGFPIFGEVAQS